MDKKNRGFEFFKPGQGSGDCGMTDLLGGRRVPKTHCIIRLNALLDDLNACIGILKSEIKCNDFEFLQFDFSEELKELQKLIIKISAKTAGMNINLQPEIKKIEEKTLSVNKNFSAPKEFIMPGANKAEALCHAARTKTRLCEISAWEADEKETACLLNRMSDYLFIICVSLSSAQCAKITS